MNFLLVCNLLLQLQFHLVFFEVFDYVRSPAVSRDAIRAYSAIK